MCPHCNFLSRSDLRKSNKKCHFSHHSPHPRGQPIFDLERRPAHHCPYSEAGKFEGTGLEDQRPRKKGFTFVRLWLDGHDGNGSTRKKLDPDATTGWAYLFCLKKWAIPGLFFLISSFQYTVDNQQMFNV